MISTVILAAGLSQRMGVPKLLLKLGDKTVLEHVVDNVWESVVSETIVVLGAHEQEFSELLSNRNIITVFNHRFQEGQGTSVAIGAATVNPHCKGILYLMGDQPFITTHCINEMIKAFSCSDAAIVRHAGSGTPAVFDGTLRSELMELSGDVGGRQLIEKYPERVYTVNIAAKPETVDLDTKRDWKEAQEYWNRFCRRAGQYVR